MQRLLRDVLRSVPALILLSCGGTGEPARAPEPAPNVEDDQGADRPVSEEGPPEGQANQRPATPSTGPPPPPVPEAFEINYRDCSELHAKYENLLRQDEMEKLENKKLPAKVQQTALEEVEKIIKEGADQWLKQCHGIVGTVQVRSRWQCAHDATDLEGFNGCVDEKSDDEEE